MAEKGESQNNTGENNEAQELQSKPLSCFVYGVIGISGILVLVIIGLAILRNEHLITDLGNPACARGLITFVFALGTTAIAVILVVAVLLRRDRIIEKRFRQGREVLGILIGILGTIVGFYFGTATQEVAKPLKIEAVKVSEAQNDLRTIGALVSGGESPYHYSVTFDNEQMTKIKEKDGISKDGWILEQIKIPTDAKDKITFTVIVKDEKNQETRKSGEWEASHPPPAE